MYLVLIHQLIKISCREYNNTSSLIHSFIQFISCWALQEEKQWQKWQQGWILRLEQLLGTVSAWRTTLSQELQTETTIYLWLQSLSLLCPWLFPAESSETLPCSTSSLSLYDESAIYTPETRKITNIFPSLSILKIQHFYVHGMLYRVFQFWARESACYGHLC